MCFVRRSPIRTLQALPLGDPPPHNAVAFAISYPSGSQVWRPKQREKCGLINRPFSVRSGTTTRITARVVHRQLPAVLPSPPQPVPSQRCRPFTTLSLLMFTLSVLGCGTAIIAKNEKMGKEIAKRLGDGLRRDTTALRKDIKFTSERHLRDAYCRRATRMIMAIMVKRPNRHKSVVLKVWSDQPSNLSVQQYE